MTDEYFSVASFLESFFGVWICNTDKLADVLSVLSVYFCYIQFS